MPLPMVHLSVANQIADSGRLNISDLPSFYLGNIAPDAIHMRDGWTYNDKVISHLGTRNALNFSERKDLLDIIAEFVKHIPLGEKRSYFLGYAVHVLADGYFLEYVYTSFLEKYRADKDKIQEEKPAYYNDTDQLDFILFNTNPHREDIWRELEISKAYDLEDILYKTEAQKWKERTLNWYDGVSEYKNPIKYITIDVLREFIPKCADLCCEFIEKASEN